MLRTTFLRALLVLLCLVAPAAPSLAALVLDEHHHGASLLALGELQVLEDAEGQLDLDAVRSAALTDRWTTAQNHPRTDGRTVLWLRADLVQRSVRGDWVVTLSSTALRDVRFFGPFDSRGQPLAEPVVTGLAHPYATRPLGSERYLMRMELPTAGHYTVYLRVDAGRPYSLEVSTWETVEFLLWRQHKRLFDGLCYGILVALLIYNLVLAWVFRDRTYVAYVAVSVFALLTLASYNGHVARYLVGGWPWLQEHVNVIAPSLWMVCSTLFAREFLDTARLAPRIDRALLGFAAFALACVAVATFSTYAMAQALVETGSTLGAWLAMTAAVVVVRAGFLPALWYVAGQTLLFAAVFATVLVNWGVLHSPFIAANGLQLGVAAEMVVFALALSSRIRLMRIDQLALRLRAAHLAEVAATDPLTGLANRAGLAQHAGNLHASGVDHALMLLDLDRFKPVNDEHGHDAGDAVLKAVADRLRAHIRGGDLVARLGGDEFVVLLAGGLPSERLAALAERLGEAVARPVVHQGRSLSVGVSIGIARAPADGVALADLMRAADAAMYRAKQAHSGHAFYEAPVAVP